MAISRERMKALAFSMIAAAGGESWWAGVETALFNQFSWLEDHEWSRVVTWVLTNKGKKPAVSAFAAASRELGIMRAESNCPNCWNGEKNLRGLVVYQRDRITGARRTAFRPCECLRAEFIKKRSPSLPSFDESDARERKEWEDITEAEYYEPATEEGRQTRDRLLAGLRASKAPTDGEGPRPVAEYIDDVGF